MRSGTSALVSGHFRSRGHQDVRPEALNRGTQLLARPAVVEHDVGHRATLLVTGLAGQAGQGLLPAQAPALQTSACT